MELKNFSYILLLLATIAIPLIGELKFRIGFFSNLKYFFPAILFSGAIFIIWDQRFEEEAIWRFNSEFLLGPKILNLPVEEWLYFLAIPMLGIFIYDYLNIHLAKFQKDNVFVVFSLILLLASGLIAWFSRQNLYPFFTFFLLTIYLGYTVFRNRFKKHYTKFYLAYFILLVPYIIISGVLTSLPVIEYNPVHNLGIRLYSIPIENFATLFLLLLMNITIYEYLKERHIYKSLNS